MIVTKPPLGWNSWNTFGHDINETLILEAADIMAESGLKDCGYEYIVIDDCWSLKERDENGLLVPDPEKFPHGMKYVADHIHLKGLKFGMYSCAGNLTCAGYPASYEHEWDDAKTFADWGVDYLKYDYCFHPLSVPGHVLYRSMALALQNCGRDILFSACSWGADETRHWIKSTGAHIWRSTGDIFDNWQSLKDLSLKAPQSIEYSGMNCFMDMDMLIVGMHGKGHVGLTGLTDDEYRMHFALWALLGSPLMIGCDIRNMDEVTKEILTNKELIKINQDASYNMPFALNFNYDDEEPCDFPAYAKILENGDIAIGLFNFSEHEQHHWDPARVTTDMIGLPESTGKTLHLTELYTGEEHVVTNGTFWEQIPPHSCKIYRARIIDK